MHVRLGSLWDECRLAPVNSLAGKGGSSTDWTSSGQAVTYWTATEGWTGLPGRGSW